MISPTSLRGSKITGTGRYCPPRVLTNEDLEKMVDTSDEWILTRTGIRERRIADRGQACSDLALEASMAALHSAGVGASELDAIIVGTVTGDMVFPATACLIQERLGAKKAAGFDVSAACCGFVYGVSNGHALIASGQMDKVLIVGVDILSKIVDWKDRATCVLFGDGAGAVVLEACSAGEGILGTYMKSDGSLADLLQVPSGGSRDPASPETCARGGHYLKMKGDGVFKYAVRAMEDAVKQVLDRANLTIDDVDLIIPHQANIRILDAVHKRLGVSADRVVVNIDRYGNTSSGTIPIALDEVVRNGRLKKGDVVLMVTFGGGLTWGSLLFRYN
ncbi:MAG: ketoacyl-ACP synthase III [Candidatus Krumholzibacteria bacterium]|nr:ketoacyl-ACP synthase III [Candidatus Krumholzibacteria bacterium]